MRPLLLVRRAAPIYAALLLDRLGACREVVDTRQAEGHEVGIVFALLRVVRVRLRADRVVDARPVVERL